MPLNPTEAAERALELVELRDLERETLDVRRAYYSGTQALPMAPHGVPREVRDMARMSRVNVVKLPVDILAQSLYVDGYRAPEDDGGPLEGGQATPTAQIWAAWQANRFDARQIQVHRACFVYSTGYVVVLPAATPGPPIMRAVSPRDMTTLYDPLEPDWPEIALETLEDGSYRLIDSEAVYYLEDVPPTPGAGPEPRRLRLLEEDGIMVHGFPQPPVVRYLATEDVDGYPVGEVEPLEPLQNQIDTTTFELLVAQHFQSFRQRYVLGWTSTDEADKAKAAASRLWTFDDPDVKVGEFGQVDLGGYLESRQATVELLATISQTPAHHLLGKVVNLAAEALAAAESGHRRKITEKMTTLGESHEQTLGLVGEAMGLEVPDGAQVRWRDTEARSLSQTVDALGKMAEMLSVPVELLWERIPGMTQQDVATAKALLAEGDSIGRLAELLDAQAAPEAPGAPAPTFP